MSKLTATITDTNGNKMFFNVNTENGRVWLVNQNRIMQSLANVMYMRHDLNGTGEKMLHLRAAVENVKTTFDLIQVLNKETKLNWK